MATSGLADRRTRRRGVRGFTRAPRKRRSRGLRIGTPTGQRFRRPRGAHPQRSRVGSVDRGHESLRRADRAAAARRARTDSAMERRGNPLGDPRRPDPSVGAVRRRIPPERPPSCTAPQAVFADDFLAAPVRPPERDSGDRSGSRRTHFRRAAAARADDRRCRGACTVRARLAGQPRRARRGDHPGPDRGRRRAHRRFRGGALLTKRGRIAANRGGTASRRGARLPPSRRNRAARRFTSSKW